MAKKTPVAARWPERVYRVLKDEGITQVAYVPDAGHGELITLCHADRAMRAVVLTSEQEGIAMLAGTWLGGARGVLLMQSSGVGNCINMLGVVQECRFPLLALVTMRGDWGEFNPWQIPMGEATPGALASAGVLVKRVDDADRVEETVLASSRLAFSTSRPVAVLIGQRVVGFKDWSR